MKKRSYLADSLDANVRENEVSTLFRCFDSLFPARIQNVFNVFGYRVG